MTYQIGTVDQPRRRPDHRRATSRQADASPGRDPAAAIARALSAGIAAVWTGDCSAAVELCRLAGPRNGSLTSADTATTRPALSAPWRMPTPDERIELYQRCLVRGTPFDIYRWINLVDLAEVWNELRLPPGVRHEWAKVLTAAGLTRPD